MQSFYAALNYSLDVSQKNVLKISCANQLPLAHFISFLLALGCCIFSALPSLLSNSWHASCSRDIENLACFTLTSPQAFFSYHGQIFPY